MDADNLSQLAPEDRLRLMRFVCSFAWADLEIQPHERSYVANLIDRLELAASERSQVVAWLSEAPPPDEIDPTTVPLEHRRVFIDAIRGVIAADGKLTPEEVESFRLFRELLS